MTATQGALHDLNDLRFFAAVVEHRGFSAAGRALGTPKSRLSKRVAQLEERLGVRLLQRTTRRFAVTDIGERFYAHCRAALEEAQAAQDVVDELRAEPRGIVRVSCPVSLAFLDAHGRPQQPLDLERLPLLSMLEHDGAQVLTLSDADGNKASIDMQARLACGEFAVLHEAARRGLGIAMLPEFVCAPALARGELEVVLPAWSMPQGTMHFVYPSRRGQLPGVRVFVEFLAERLPGAVQLKQEQCACRKADGSSG